MVTTVRILVERMDGSRVAELRPGTPLDRVGERGATAGEMAQMLSTWACSPRPTTDRIAVGAAQRQIRRQPADEMLRVRHASVTATRLPRKLPSYLRT